jgi:heterodisulfide reductase subunit D
MSKQLGNFKDEVYNCLNCGACMAVYGSFLQICPAGERFGFLSYYSRGRNSLLKALLEGRAKWSEKLTEMLFACPLCGACSAQCPTPYGDHIINILEAVRAEAVAKGIAPLTKQRMFGEHIRREHNPYFESHKDRWNWIPKDKKLPEKADVVYFVGCTSSYRQTNVALATLKILEKVGVNFTILKDEWCCGSPMLRTGQLNGFLDLAKHNVELIRKADANELITSCAGCYRAWRKDYKDAGIECDFRISHVAEFLKEAIEGGGLELADEFGKKVTYHDPCHLGRHCGVYDPPREVLSKIPGLELVEMERNRDGAWCCGSGGGVKSAFPEFAVWAAGERLREAKDVGAEALISACPFCLRNLLDAKKKFDYELEVCDLAEIVAKLI